MLGLRGFCRLEVRTASGRRLLHSAARRTGSNRERRQLQLGPSASEQGNRANGPNASPQWALLFGLAAATVAEEKPKPATELDKQRKRLQDLILAHRALLDDLEQQLAEAQTREELREKLKQLRVGTRKLLSDLDQQLGAELKPTKERTLLKTIGDAKEKIEAAKEKFEACTEKALKLKDDLKQTLLENTGVGAAEEQVKEQQKSAPEPEPEPEQPLDPAYASFEHEVPDFGPAKWEPLYSDPRCTVHRRWLTALNTYEYRCTGTYLDINSADFVRAQLDNDYRKQWDPHVLEISVIGSTADNKEVVRWLHKFPRPLNPRVYIFSRTYRHDQRDVYSVESRGLAEAEFASLKTDKSYVRVETYSSTLRVRPHKKFEENGLDFLLVYYDYPKAVIPGPAYNWMISKGGPYFLEHVHEAAKQLAADKAQPKPDKKQQAGKKANNVKQEVHKKDNGAASAPDSASTPAHL